MKKIFIILLIVLMSVPSILFNKAETVEAKTVADLREELRKALEKETNNNANIERSEAEIANIKAQISSNYTRIDEINNEIIKADEEIVELEEDIKEKDRTAKNLMASLQTTNGNSFYIEYLFGADSISDFIYRFSITEQITTYNEKLINEMNEMIDTLEEKKVDLKNKQTELKSKQQELNTQLNDLNKSKVKLYELGSSIEAEIKSAKQILQMYVDAGCKDNDDISVCANKLLPPDTKFWRPFETGYVTSEYGWRNAIYHNGVQISNDGLHEGIDLSNSLGKNNPIYPVANGKVAVVTYDSMGGHQVLIHHNINGKSYTSWYAHFSKILVKVDEVVTKDTVIGYMGASGSATGYHLHLAIATGLKGVDYYSYSSFVSRTINPRKLINFPSYGSWKDRVHQYN